MSAEPATGGDLRRRLAWIAVLLGAWFALQRWVLPALGCRT